MAVVALGILTWTFLQRSSDSQDTVLADLAAITPPAPNAPDDFPAIVDSAVRDPATRTTPVGATFEIVEEIPHDVGAFTQGLEIAGGRLFESTGLVGESSIREVDINSGATIRIQPVADVFAEGLTIDGDSALQLTWRDGEAFRYDLDTFTRTETYTYEGEGWGLCKNGEQLVMSDGSPTLQFRDPESFVLLRTVEVTFGNALVDELNELECVDGRVWANIWHSSLIIEIDPSDGKVITVLNARSLTPPSVEGSSSNVLNGIAYDPADNTFLLTGKRWPTIFRVRIIRLAE